MQIISELYTIFWKTEMKITPKRPWGTVWNSSGEKILVKMVEEYFDVNLYLLGQFDDSLYFSANCDMKLLCRSWEIAVHELS